MISTFAIFAAIASLNTELSYDFVRVVDGPVWKQNQKADAVRGSATMLIEKDQIVVTERIGSTSARKVLRYPDSNPAKDLDATKKLLRNTVDSLKANGMDPAEIAALEQMSVDWIDTSAEVVVEGIKCRVRNEVRKVGNVRIHITSYIPTDKRLADILGSLMSSVSSTLDGRTSFIFESKSNVKWSVPVKNFRD